MTNDLPPTDAHIRDRRPLPSASAFPDLDEPPRFPIETLPPEIRAYVESSAASARVPVEMVAAPFLAFHGAVIGNQLRFDVGNGWIERPHLWIALIAPTGAGKSPAITAARRPLDLLQAESFVRYRLLLQLALLDRPLGSTSEPVAFDRFYTTDPTVDSLVEDLQHVPGLAIVRDELVGIVRAMSGRGARADERQKYLSLWSGHPLAPSRKRDTAAWIQHPVVSIVGGIQPGVVPKLRSHDHDGMIERFLPLTLGVAPPYWKENVAVIDAPDAAEMARWFRFLRRRAFTPEPDGLLIGRTAEAAANWSAWFNENVDRSRAAPSAAAGFYQKLPAHVARLAMILQILWRPDIIGEPVSAANMAHAIALGEFFRGHIHRTLRLLGEDAPAPLPEPDLARRIIRILLEQPGHEGWLTRTQLLILLKRPDTNEFNHAIGQLHERGEISHTRRPPPGSRKSALHYRAT